MNFYAYRLPGADDIVTSKGGELDDGISVKGFALCGFDTGNRMLHTIAEGEPFELCEMNRMAFEDMLSDLDTFPETGTTREEHREAVECIVDDIHKELYAKAVTARIIVEERRIDLGRTFERMCVKYPDAFLFCIHSDIAGTWIGATPETLIRKHDGRISTMALAGTRPAGTEGCWDKKNIHEHNVVTLYIIGELMELGASPAMKQASSAPAGPVEHLMTPIWFDIPSDMTEMQKACLDPRLIALRLSPTPALCGYPQDVALGRIREIENFERGFYGGFLGPYSPLSANDGDADFFVNLRSMRCEPGRICIYAGGGITIDSDPDSEWEETEAKARTMRSVIVERD